MKFGIWSANAPALLLLLPCSCIAPGLLLACSQPSPGLLMVCSCPALDPAHPSFATFIIIISTLQLFSAWREPPFMVYLLGQWSLICLKRLIFIVFDKSMTDGRTNWQTDGRTDRPSFRDARTHLKKSSGITRNASSLEFKQNDLLCFH